MCDLPQTRFSKHSFLLYDVQDLAISCKNIICKFCIFTFTQYVLTVRRLCDVLTQRYMTALCFNILLVLLILKKIVCHACMSVNPPSKNCSTMSQLKRQSRWRDSACYCIIIAVKCVSLLQKNALFEYAYRSPKGFLDVQYTEYVFGFWAYLSFWQIWKKKKQTN